MAALQVNMDENKDKILRQPQNGARATMNNQTSTDMKLDRFHNWSGIPAKPGFPDTIVANFRALFTHLKDGKYGSKAAVIYNGLNEKNVPCAWVLAWYAPADSTTTSNQVFVLCGPKPVIDILSFDDIGLLLDKSIAHSEFADPKVSETRAVGDINDHNPCTATVEATFSLIA